jgi:hypothetical protein
MKRLVYLAAGAVLAATAGPAAASPAFDAFRQVCGDTHGDFAAVKAAVAGPGWKPTEVKAATMQGVTVVESVARAEVAGRSKVTLYAWRGTKGTVQVNACTVRVSAVPMGDLVADSQGWAGFTPQTNDKSKTVWRFTVADGAHKALQESDYNAAAAGAGLEFFTLSADGADTLLDLLTIKA